MKRPPFVFISTISDRSISSHTTSHSGGTTSSTVYMDKLLDPTYEATRMWALRKRWTSKICDGSQTPYEDIQCCKMLRCLESCDQQFHALQRATVIQVTQRKLRRILSSVLNSDQTFVFSGSRACNKFLATAFHFSNDM